MANGELGPSSFEAVAPTLNAAPQPALETPASPD